MLMKRRRDDGDEADRKSRAGAFDPSSGPSERRKMRMKTTLKLEKSDANICQRPHPFAAKRK